MIDVQTRELIKLMKNKLGIIILFGLIFSLFVFYAFIFTQKRYETSTDYLIVQNQEGAQDFYSLSKSVEYLGGILSEAVYSSVFIEELKKSDKVDKGYFPFDTREALKKWKKNVNVERNANLGIMKIRVYDNNKDSAMNISQGISEMLINKNYLFSGKVNLDVRVLSGPITEKNPSLVKILLVVLGGFIAGCAIKILHIYYSFIWNLIKREDDREYLGSLRDIE